MLNSNAALTFTNLYLSYLLPFDISKQYMLQENRRIYALLMCFNCACGYFMTAIFFDEYMFEIAYWPFFVDRLIAVINLSVSFLILLGNARTEIREIFARREANYDTEFLPTESVNEEVCVPVNTRNSSRNLSTTGESK